MLIFGFERPGSAPLQASDVSRSTWRKVFIGRGGMILALLLALVVTARAQNPVEVSQIPIPPGTEIVIGLEAVGSTLYLFTRNTFYTSPLYSGNSLTFTQTTNLPFPLMPMTLPASSRVTPDPTDPNHFFFTGGTFSPILYRYRLDPQAVSTVPLPKQGSLPSGIAVDGAGNAYSSCPTCTNQLIFGEGNSSCPTCTIPLVIKFNSGDGTFVQTIGTAGAGTLNSPSALEFGPDGLLYVLDTGASRIAKFDSNGNYQGQIPLIGTTDPGDIAIGPDGRLYTANGNGGGTIYNIYTGAVVGTLSPTSDVTDDPRVRTRLAISGNYLYLMDGNTGLHIYDVSVPADDDGDGVANEADLCPGTASGAMVNADGCSAEQLCIAPPLAYAATASVSIGGTTTVSPTTPLPNDGSISSVIIVDVVPALNTAPTVDASGVVSITNAAPSGNHVITVKATRSCGESTTTSFTLNVICSFTLPPSVSTGIFKTPYSASVAASPNVGQTYSVMSGELPPGLILNQTTGAITGTPTQAGSYTFTIQTQAGDCGATKVYTIVINCPSITLNPASLANGAVGSSYNMTITATNGTTPLGGVNYLLLSGSLPPGLSLTQATGAITGTPSQSGNYSFTIRAEVGGCSAAKSYTIFIGCPAITINPAALAGGVVGANYSANLTASISENVQTGVGYLLQSGSLPPGLNLNPGTGMISGAPTIAGSYNFTIKASVGGCSVTRSLTITISCAPITINPASLGAGTLGNAYSATLSTTNGETPVSGVIYSVIGGSLPGGLTLNSTTGAISGTPSTVGSYIFTIKAQAGGCSATRSFTLVIGCPTIALSPGTLANGTVGAGYSVSFAVTPGGNYQYFVTGSLPPGLTLSPTTGVLSGTPTTASTYTFTITAKRAGNCTGSQSYTLTINPAACPPSITLPAMPNGKVGQYYIGSASAAPSGSYSYAVTDGALPPGVSLINSLGLLVGAPTTSGTYNFEITATRNGGGGCTGSRSYAVTIAAP